MPNYTYNTGIPDAPNNPSDDQPLMKTNTDSINSILNEDMIGFGNTNGGFHSKITYVNQGSDPGSSSAQYIEYSKATSGSSEMYAQKDAVAASIQLTRGVPTTNANGSYSYLPGGFLIQWGSVTAVSNAATVTFPITFTSAPTSVTATVRNLAGIYGVASVRVPSATGVIINSEIINQTIYWMAIGV